MVLYLASLLLYSFGVGVAIFLEFDAMLVLEGIWEVKLPTFFYLDLLDDSTSSLLMSRGGTIGTSMAVVKGKPSSGCRDGGTTDSKKEFL